MARGIQPSAEQLAEERSITLLSATDELVTWDRREAALTNRIHAAVARGEIQQALADIRLLQRGDVLENSDHVELFEAVRAG